MSDSFLPQIQHVVVLMLENRSLDNLLGWLYADQPPANVYPAGSSPSFDGLLPHTFSNPIRRNGSVQSEWVTPVPAGPNQDRFPLCNPNEALNSGNWSGVMNQVFGNQNAIGGLPATGTSAAMQGFLQDYQSTGDSEPDILWTFTPRQAPVINGLALQYAVSDAWFSSVPTDTNPNRAFSLCGTSLGFDSDYGTSFDTPTLFNAVADADLSWRLYYSSEWENGHSFTFETFPQIQSARNGQEEWIEAFFQSAAAGTLPAFSYLEPAWGIGDCMNFEQGNDYHPPTHITDGERFLYQVYAALRSGPLWEQTLFIVTFDEHGGTYDHVGPQWGAVNPDGAVSPNGFEFNLFGVRVPTLLISPYVPAGTVFRAPSDSQYPFDHTSLLKTLLLWAGGETAARYGARTAVAPTFDGVLSSSIVNTGTFVPPTPWGSGPIGTDTSLNTQFKGVPFAEVRRAFAVRTRP